MKTNSTSRSAFFNARLLVGFALCSLGVLPALAGWSQFVTGTIATKAPAEAPGLWETTGSLATPRFLHTATLLPNGQVLVAGGIGRQSTLSRARNSMTRRPGYGPRRAAWPRRETLIPRHSCPTARCSSLGDLLASPISRARNSMIRRPGCGPRRAEWPPRDTDHTATLLPNGQVLVAGGSDGGLSRERGTL